MSGSQMEKSGFSNFIWQYSHPSPKMSDAEAKKCYYKYFKKLFLLLNTRLSSTPYTAEDDLKFLTLSSAGIIGWWHHLGWLIGNACYYVGSTVSKIKIDTKVILIT